MSLALTSQLILNSYHKMDNVLYEIRDNRGIPKNKYYEPWKEEILNELQILGFIVQESDLYVLTETGREVIKNVSFKVYNQKLKFGKVKPEEESVQGKSKRNYLKHLLILLFIGQLSILLFLTLYKF